MTLLQAFRNGKPVQHTIQVWNDFRSNYHAPTHQPQTTDGLYSKISKCYCCEGAGMSRVNEILIGLIQEGDWTGGKSISSQPAFTEAEAAMNAYIAKLLEGDKNRLNLYPYKCPNCNGIGEFTDGSECQFCDSSGRLDEQEFNVWRNSLLTDAIGENETAKQTEFISDDAYIIRNQLRAEQRKRAEIDTTGGKSGE